MKILFDITHPAHVHLFKYVIQDLKDRGNDALIVARDKDITLELLKEYGFYFQCLSKAKKGLGMFIEFLQHEWKLYHIAKRFKPDIMINVVGTFIAPVGRILGIPTVAFTDTEHARLTNSVTFPFIGTICTPSCYKDNISDKQIKYEGYHELAYLHLNRFKPNPEVLREMGLSENEKFFIVRFVSWQALHDIGKTGFTDEGKRKFIKKLEKYGKVIISSESHLPEEFEKYRMSISPTKIHSLLYYATMYIGEGATMASEAAVLGTPAIFVSSITAGTLEEQEKKYGLLHSFRDEDAATKKILELLKIKDLKQKWQKKRQIMLRDKIDVTTWIVESFATKFKLKHWL